MRVVFSIDNMGIGGTELNALRTAQRLDRRRFELRVVCLGADGPLRERYAALGVPVIFLSSGRLSSPGALRQGRALVGLLRDWETDVLHSHDHYSNVFTTICGRIAGVPAVIASRRWWQSLPRRSHQLANIAAYRLADLVLANSPAVAALVRRESGLPAARVAVVPNFVDEDAFVPFSLPRAERLRAFGIPEGSIVVSIVASLTPLKDHPTLLAAVAMLADHVPALHLLVVGDGPCRSALEAETETLGLGGRVHFAGALPHTPSAHHLADIAVLCSRSEGFPNSLVEAMAAGKPVVATAVGGVADAVERDVTGLLVPPGEPTALASALHLLLRDRALREAMGSAGRRRAEQAFHARSVLPRLEELYSGLVGATGRRSSEHPDRARLIPRPAGNSLA